MQIASLNNLRNSTALAAICALSVLFIPTALARVKADSAMVKSMAPTQCLGSQLSVHQVPDSENAAMGGHRLVDYAFKNTSSEPCTLMGYPRFELLNKSGRLLGRVRVVNRAQLMGEDEKRPPSLVSLEPGKEAWFRIYYNSGGAGYTGKPCPTSVKVRITAPGTKRAFVLRDEIQSCRNVEVSAVRSGKPSE